MVVLSVSADSPMTSSTLMFINVVVLVCIYVARESPAHFEKLIQTLFLHLKNQKNSPFLVEVLGKDTYTKIRIELIFKTLLPGVY